MKGEAVKRTARRPRPVGIDVSPEAVRRARLEAGLTLAEVARGHVTRAAIHLIEAGKARPSMATLQLISERTGKPISYFVAAAPSDRAPASALRAVRRASRRSEWPEVSQLEALKLAGDAPSLGEAARRLIATATDPHARAHAHYYLGLAQLDGKEPQAAVDNFRTARHLFNQLRDAWMVVECGDAEAGALYALERPEALAAAEEALARCRELTPLPASTEVRILGHLGSIHISRHDWKEAVRYYEEAVARAGAIRDLSRMARMYQDLGSAYQELGALSQAASYSQKALGLYEMQHNSEALAYVENNLALVLMKLGELGAAERHLQASLSGFESLGLERRKSNVLLTLSDLELARNNPDAAETYAAEALRLAEANDERLTAARAHQSLGQLAAESHDIEETDRRFEVAIKLLTAADAGERLIESHKSYAEILKKRGDREAAYAHVEAALALARPYLPRDPAQEAPADNWRAS